MIRIRRAPEFRDLTFQPGIPPSHAHLPCLGLGLGRTPPVLRDPVESHECAGSVRAAPAMNEYRSSSRGHDEVEERPDRFVRYAP